MIIGYALNVLLLDLMKLSLIFSNKLEIALSQLVQFKCNIQVYEV